MKKYILLAAVLLAVSCSHKDSGSDFRPEELALIESADSIMRVLTVRDSADFAVLRAHSDNLSAEALRSDDYRRLCSLMVATVTHPSQDGVGIAGPQVGLNRRVVAVQRFDKEPVLHEGLQEYPFEVYPNIRIVWASDSLTAGPEGCLSVPDRRGEVLRSTSIVIEYADMVFTTAQGHDPSNRATQSPENHPITLNRLRHAPHAIQDNHLINSDLQKAIPMVRDTISGFTAVIFQHEIDHLDGVLYTDRLERYTFDRKIL